MIFYSAASEIHAGRVVPSWNNNHYLVVLHLNRFLKQFSINSHMTAWAALPWTDSRIFPIGSVCAFSIRVHRPRYHTILIHTYSNILAQVSHINWAAFENGPPGYSVSFYFIRARCVRPSNCWAGTDSELSILRTSRYLLTRGLRLPDAWAAMELRARSLRCWDGIQWLSFDESVQPFAHKTMWIPSEEVLGLINFQRDAISRAVNDIEESRYYCNYYWNSRLFWLLDKIAVLIFSPAKFANGPHPIIIRRLITGRGRLNLNQVTNVAMRYFS